VANLEAINFRPMREVIEDGKVCWVSDKLARPFDGLPQIFWDSGEPWHEANHWTLTKATSTHGGHIKTVTTLAKHLAAYASWLEFKGLDWRHFPIRKQDRALVLFRGDLIEQRNRGSLAASTAHARMAAVIQFYRHAQIYGFVQRQSPLWKDHQVILHYFDSVGFERTIMRTSSELSIPNKRRPGLRLEDGLTPLRIEDATSLLEFTKEQGLQEINLMLSLGILTGARIETITSLGVKNIENAYPDAQTPDTYRVRVGPGTGVNTKFDVTGELLVPRFLIDQLKFYAYTMRRLKRQSVASEGNRGLLFLTTRGSRYESGSFNRLMTDLRRRTSSVGLRFMANFKFHQTRATFGTWLMGVALRVTNTKAAVAFVRDAMLHKDEKTTFLYVHFIEQEPVKAEIANEFSAAFSGIVNRDWNQYRA
jgi:integrase